MGIAGGHCVSTHAWDQVMCNLEAFLFKIQELELYLTLTETHVFSTTSDSLKNSKFLELIFICGSKKTSFVGNWG